MSLTLYYAPGACSLVPHVALEQAGATYETVRLSLADGDQRKPDYLAINPKGRVPTLVVEGRPLTEVVAIVTYLDRRFEGAGIVPGPDPVLTARAYEVMTWLASTVHVAFAQITRAERYADDPEVKAALAAPGRDRFVRTLHTLEALSATDDAWLVGDAFSAVDVYALVVRRWAERIGVDVAAFPSWTAKTDLVLKTPAVIRALAHETAPVAAVAA